jgi:hypothetical protein
MPYCHVGVLSYDCIAVFIFYDLVLSYYRIKYHKNLKIKWLGGINTRPWLMNG